MLTRVRTHIGYEPWDGGAGTGHDSPFDADSRLAGRYGQGDGLAVTELATVRQEAHDAGVHGFLVDLDDEAALGCCLDAPALDERALRALLTQAAIV
jgi:hypothetical protein